MLNFPNSFMVLPMVILYRCCTAEEELFDDPWKLLVACMLLNKTSGAQVRWWRQLTALHAGGGAQAGMDTINDTVPVPLAPRLAGSMGPGAASHGSAWLSARAGVPSPPDLCLCPSAPQVRKVIWQLFALCPTPAAAIAADVQQVQALIQPLGLFRKRAAAIQQLSQDYLYKQVRTAVPLAAHACCAVSLPGGVFLALRCLLARCLPAWMYGK